MTLECPVLATASELAPGYRVLGHLRQGNDLDVYEVWSDERDCLCIAKTPRADRVDDASVRRRLTTEGRLLGRLTHPHIVRAYATLKQPRLAVVLETLPGATLGHLIDTRRRRLAWSDLVLLGLHLCSAMAYLHRQGYVHLDLKPSNVVADRGVAKVLDLSIARRPGRCPRGIGSPPYMAPEQARGGRIGPPADVWGIGVVLFEAAAGRRPFRARGTRTGYGQLEARADAIARHRRLPVPLARLIDDCLDPAAAGRPPLSAVAATLNELG